MLISLKNLSNAAGGFLDFNYIIDLSHEKVNYDFPFQSPVKISGRLTDKSGAIFFDATADFSLSVACARCNRVIDVPQKQEVHFLLSTSAQNDEEAPDDIYYLTSDAVDTDEIIVPEIFMSVDMSYLCSEDCKGLCPVCGGDLNEASCGCVKKEIDPRLQKLAQLLEEK